MVHNNAYKIKLILLLILITVSGAGCGYKFSGGGKMPAGTGEICISLFNNRSSETMLENTIMNDLVYEFTRNGQTTAKDEETADSVMTGEILSVTSDTVTHSGDLTSLESRVSVSLSVQVKNSKGSILWENLSIKDSEVYSVDSSNTIDSAAKKAALKKISERISVKIYSGMTEDF